MTEAIQLKGKYRTGKRYKTNRSSSDRSQPRHRKKLGGVGKRQLPPQPQRVMVLENGRVRMIGGDGE